MKTKQHIAEKYFLTAILLLAGSKTIACEACKKQQPKVLQGIAHGPGPDNTWDYLIVAIMIAITLYVLIATIKCLVKPAEKDSQHIKNMILND